MTAYLYLACIGVCPIRLRKVDWTEEGKTNLYVVHLRRTGIIATTTGKTAVLPTVEPV